MSNANPITATKGADPNTVEERKNNLPLPEQPPVASDWNSSDERTVNVGSGGTEGPISHGGGSSSLHEPATGDSFARVDGSVTGTHTAGGNVGRTAVDGLGGLPNDAVAREAKGKPGLADTTGKDHGHPQKNDPSKGL